MVPLRLADFVFFYFFINNALTSFVFSAKLASRSGRKLKPLYVVEQLSGLSKIGCATACADRAWCLGVSWRAPSQPCLMTNADAITSWTDLNFFTEIDGAWTTFGEIRFPIALYWGPGGRYTMTYSQALQRCATEGSTMAREADMWAALQQGIHICNHGWVLEQKRILIMQFEDFNCFPWFDTGYVVCDPIQFPNSDVWCLIK